MFNVNKCWSMQRRATIGEGMLRGACLVCCVGRNRSSSRGFTLVELMIGLVLVAILMSIGLPMFRSFTLGQQLRATTSDLRIALTLARSEAVKRNRVVALQPFDADDGWGSGWIIPSPLKDDPDDPCLMDVPTEPFDPDDICLLAHRQKGDVTITTNPDVASLQFTPMGRAASVVEFEVDIGPPESSIQGCMQLELDGRITSTPGECSGG